MFELPTTIQEIDKFIQDQVQENLHLDYKDSRAIDNGKRQEIAKDVSAFANSDGGLLIYGVVEQSQLPVRMDDGVDHTKYKREWIEQLINNHISPRIDDVRIAQIPISPDKSVYAIRIPKTYRGPHQSYDKKYYKRFNFNSEPMEDYEINDVRSRQRTLQPLVNVDIKIKGRVSVFLVVSNIGQIPAQDVTFKFSKQIKWRGNKGTPSLFTRGVKYLPPNRTFHFFYNSFIGVFANGTEVPSNFDVEVSYLHPEINQRISDTFHIDLMDYMNSYVDESEIAELGKKLQESLKELKNEISKLNTYLNKLSTLSGATGLDISIPTLKNIGHILAGDGEVERIDPTNRRAEAFKQLLGVSDDIAYTLECYFMSMVSDEELRSIEGMTEEIYEKLKKHFLIDEPENT